MDNIAHETRNAEVIKAVEDLQKQVQAGVLKMNTQIGAAEMSEAEKMKVVKKLGQMVEALVRA